MEWIEIVLYMAGSIGALLLGFDLLSTNVTKLFHKRLKQLFNKTSKNNLIGVAIGTASTAIMQSSAATTVMVVGFVNTGIMTLMQATAIIMGANIGTTITAQLASLSSFDFGSFAVAFAGIGVFITMLAKKDGTKTFGRVLSGFGLLFLGLMCMSDCIKGNPQVKEVISGILSQIDGTLAPLWLFLLGVGLTALVQSSSLITTIIISLTTAGIYIGAGEGATGLTNNVLFLILGTNIGTCVTALISSIGTSTNAKRASIIHLLFNLFGSLIFIVFLLVWKDFMTGFFCKIFPNSATQIAMFHTFFNIVCTFVFLPFIKWFVKASEFLVKDKEEKQEGLEFTYIDERMIKSPAIAIHQVRREMSKLFNKAVDILNISLDAFFNKDNEQKEAIDNMNNDLELMEKQIVEFLVKLSNEDLTYDDECTISVFHRALNDILRIGEIGDNVCKYTRHVVKANLEFSEPVLVQISLMRNTINKLYSRCDEVFLSKDLGKLVNVDEIENEIDKMRKLMVDDHFERLNKGECLPQNSGVFVNLVNNLERAADHMTYIAYSVKEAFEQTKAQ